MINVCVLMLLFHVTSKSLMLCNVFNIHLNIIRREGGFFTVAIWCVLDFITSHLTCVGKVLRASRTGITHTHTLWCIYVISSIPNTDISRCPCPNYTHFTHLNAISIRIVGPLGWFFQSHNRDEVYRTNFGFSCKSTSRHVKLHIE